MFIRRLSLVLLLFVVVPCFGAVKGTLTVNGKTFDLKYAYATAKKNPFDKSKSDVVVLMTDKEIPAEAIHDEFELMRVVDSSKLAGVSIEIDPDKQVISGMVYSPAFKKMGQISGAGNQKLELTARDDQHVAGKVTVAENSFFDDKYAYSASFDVPITAKPAPKALPGTPLPAGGGEIGKAYEAYRKAMKAGNMAVIRKSVAADNAKQMDDPDFKKMFPLIQSMQPKKIKITGGAVDGDNATLTVLSLDEANTTGTVKMVREGGQWKMMKESWKTTSE